LPTPGSKAAYLIPVTGFPPGRITSLDSNPEKYSAQPAGIQLGIPTLGLNLPVVGVPQVDGQWDVSWLGDQAGYLEGTAFPTWAGNSAIASHVTGADGEPGPFANLAQLTYGDEVDLRAWGYKYIYLVRDNRLVVPNDQSVFRHEDYTWVTLLTCQGYDPVTDTYRFRRAVRAVLVSIVPEP
jgi:LPXTG-site transpeptidase (sortase) family protein